MKDVLRTNDPVKFSYAESLLRDAGIEAVALDDAMSSLYSGDVSFIKRRLMVADDDYSAALNVLTELDTETE